MNESLWINSSKSRTYKKLDKDIETECLIVGAGLTGITTAYLLARRGIKVAIIDASCVGGGATGRNTGKLTPQHNLVYSKIEKVYGNEVAKEYYSANEEAVKLVEKIIKENDIQCDFERVDSYIFTEDIEKTDEIREEFEVCKDLGIECEFSMDCPLPFNTYGSIKFTNTAQFNPKKYIDALAKKVVEMGEDIYEETTAVNLKSGEIITVETSGGYKIKVKSVFICSHSPFYDGLSFYFTRLKPERSYVVAARFNGNFPKATFINIDKISRSLRYYKNYDDGKEYILIAGEKHKVGHNKDKECYENLKDYGRINFNVEDYEYQWSTQDYITPDNIPYIGYLNSVEKNIFVATGFAKWGMTNGTVAAMVLTRLYLNEKFKYDDIFNTSRIRGYFSKEFIAQNTDTAIQYVIGKFKIGSEDMPERGEGKIVKTSKGRYGAYRDDKDYLHIVDITCTHLGCELKWNKLEKTWDCPCHGSRFSVDGEILEGPATLPLNSYGEGKNTINIDVLIGEKMKN